MTKTIALRSMLCMLFLLLLTAGDAMAQQRTIKGKLTERDGTPIQGATISLLRGNASTLSDAQGMFTLQFTSPNTTETIVISSVGFVTQEVENTEGETHNLQL